MISRVQALKSVFMQPLGRTLEMFFSRQLYVRECEFPAGIFPGVYSRERDSRRGARCRHESISKSRSCILPTVASWMITMGCLS